MAKNMRKMFAILLALAVCVALIAFPAAADGGPGGPGPNQPGPNQPGPNQPGSGEQGGGGGEPDETGNEYIQISVNGQSQTVSGDAGNDSWLINGEYDDPVIDIQGNDMSYQIGNQTGNVTLPIPDGYTISGFEMDPVSVNSHEDRYDNAIINIKVTQLTNNNTGETVPVDPDKPITIPTNPTTQPTEPTTQPTEPTTQPTEPTTQPTQPTEPTTQPTAPTTQPTEPTTQPTEPTTQPTEPTTQPTEPTTQPTEPTTQPTEPTTQPTEPTTQPTQPTTQPTQPTTQPTQPQTPTTQHQPQPHNDDGEEVIEDEEVPLADVPKTGDVSMIWVLLSGLSAGGLMLTGKKRDEE